MNAREIILERLAKLLSVKSLVTLALTAVLAALLFADIDPAPELLALFCTTYGSIITFFFTRKDDKQ